MLDFFNKFQISLTISVFLLFISLFSFALFFYFWNKNKKNLLFFMNEQNFLRKQMQEFYNFSEKNRQIDLHTINEAISEKLKNQSISSHSLFTEIQTRLNVIDSAQKNMLDLTSNILNLQDILSNKQTRGIFGQKQMEIIIQDALPPKHYAFQATLSNGKRPDCLIYMPNNSPALVIDAKFPLESWTQYKNLNDEEEKKITKSQFRRDIEVHIKNISEKYLIPGETQEIAFLFVPSESVFLSIHEEFDELIQKAFKSGVMIISPALLLISISIVKSIFKDIYMREQAHLIQKEIHKLIEDISRLDQRTTNLQKHFIAAQKDIEEISTSTQKIKKTSEKITNTELENNYLQN